METTKYSYSKVNYNDLEGQERYDALISQKDPEILKKWGKEQYELKEKLKKTDDPSLQNIKYIAGVDISFLKSENNNDKNSPQIGISALVICEYKTLKIVYEDYKLVTIDEPYIPGFLAFREVKHFVNLSKTSKKMLQSISPK